ncbi:ROK family protein [Kitasatospora sp. NPDC059327]|uniref:ROK family protein n=1 Tax=Kitasatospora sp. NPDC059327 TaxID=3346803 RepID=UPI0036CDCA67
MTPAISYLGIDVGGTKVALRAEADRVPALEASFRWPEPGDPAADLAALADHVARLLGRWGRTPQAVGVAMPATLDAGGRVLSWPNRPSWTGLDVRAALAGSVPGAEVRCADDGDLAAVAEADAMGCRNVVYLGVGTGIGGGVVADGRPFPGPERGSCEAGHLVIDRSGPRCDCGRRGCVQAVASGPAILRRAALARAGRTRTGRASGPVEPVAYDALRQGWSAKEAWAVDTVREGCAALAAAVTGLCELAHPEAVVIGGGFADGLPGFAAAVGEEAALLARPGQAAVPVRPAALGGLSSLRGAVLLARAAVGGPPRGAEGQA